MLFLTELHTLFTLMETSSAVSVCPTRENACCIASPAQVWSLFIPEYHFSRWIRTRYDILCIRNTRSFTKCLHAPCKWEWGLLAHLRDQDTEGVQLLSHSPLIPQCLLLCLVPLLALVYLLVIGRARAAGGTSHLRWCSWAMVLSSHPLTLPCVLESNLFSPPP